MDETDNTPVSFPETRFYRWEEVQELTMGAARSLLYNRVYFAAGKPKEAWSLTSEWLEALWNRKGFDVVPTKKLKKLLIAAAHEVGWYPVKQIPRKKKPPLPDDPTLKTCPTCNETKPRTQFVRRVSSKRALQYGWNTHSQIRIAHERCNYCASPKRKSILGKRTTPSIAKVRKQINDRLKVTRCMADSPYRTRKLQLLGACQLKVKDYLVRKVRGPDEWHMMLTKEERQELETLYLRVDWKKRKPDVF
jgi:hypothetical protein